MTKITDLFANIIDDIDVTEVAMKSLGEIELQLSRLGINNRFWGKPEIRELQNILDQDETIKAAVNGRYHGGYSLLTATDRRLLLIDKKMWFLNIEDVRFDMILEVDYCARLLDSTLSIRTFNKVLHFSAMKQQLLRNLTGYIQQRVTELRQHAPQSDFNGSYAQVNVPMYQQPPINPDPTPTYSQPTIASVQEPSYAAQTVAAPPGRVKRIGVYPTASFTVQQRYY